MPGEERAQVLVAQHQRVLCGNAVRTEENQLARRHAVGLSGGSAKATGRAARPAFGARRLFPIVTNDARTTTLHQGAALWPSTSPSTAITPAPHPASSGSASTVR